MPDYGTTTPTAGWYTDPANATLERWWGGVEWTHDTRPIAVIAAPEPALAAVPGGGVNPFAAEATPSWGTSTTPVTQAQSVGSYHAEVAVAGPAQVAAGWYDQGNVTQSETPRNGAAVRALVFSIIAWIFNPLFIFTILAFTSAKRGLENASMFEYQRREPVGRSTAKIARAIAGIGLALYLIGFGLGVWAAVGGGGFISDVIRPLYSAFLPSGQNPADGDLQFDSTSNPGIWAFYERSTFEGAIRDGFVSEGVTPDSVTCPDMIVATKGTSFSCQIVVSGGPVEAQWTFTDDEGGYEQYINGVLVE